MKIPIQLTCPICDDTMTMLVSLVNEEEGDHTIPNGINRYVALDDYDFPKQTAIIHAKCIYALQLAQDAEATKYPQNKTTQLDTLLDEAYNLAYPIFTDNGPNSYVDDSYGDE